MLIIIFLILFLYLTNFNFSSSKNIVSKVAIVGAGPAGLSLCASLQKTGSLVETIRIFEAKKDPKQASLGGGLQ